MINVQVRNPIIKSTFTVFGFWWVVLTLVALGSAAFNKDGLEVAAKAALVSLCVTIGGALLGFFGRLAWRSGYSILSESMLKEGDEWNGAISRLGALPRLDPPPMANLPKNIDDLAPWLAPMRKKFPLHAAAAEDVIRVMMTEPTLPASPVPGGHGGRTLLAHSLGVVESMLEEAPRWVYRGQFKRDGRTLVVPARKGEHRFGPEDLGLLILTALAHDIGKIVCYKLVDKNAVVEVKPNHDIEGGKLLRRLPSVMALPLEDRRALITACTYYHHPFGMPLVEWCDDRVRSLTELLIVADQVTGKKEGHVLTSIPVEDDDDEAPMTELERKTAAAVGAVVGKNIEILEEGANLFDAVDRMAIAIPETSSAQEVAEAPWEMEEKTEANEKGAAAKSGRAEINCLYKLFADNPNLVNGPNAGQRVAFKQGKRLYVCEPRLRGALQMSPWDTGFTPEQLKAPPVGREANPFTKRLLSALSEAGYLLQSIDVPGENRIARFNPISSIFRIRTQTTKSKAPAKLPTPFFIIPAGAFGMDDMEDWPFEIEITEPFFGWSSEAGKPRKKKDPAIPNAPATTSAAEAENAPEDAQGNDAAPTPATVPASMPAQESSIDADDLPDFGDKAETTRIPTKEEYLKMLHDLIRASGMAPIKTTPSGHHLYYTDGAAAGVIARFLAEHGLDEMDLGIDRKVGAAGREVMAIPGP